jgi:hypothetical protein
MQGKRRIARGSELADDGLDMCLSLRLHVHVARFATASRLIINGAMPDVAEDKRAAL